MTATTKSAHTRTEYKVEPFGGEDAAGQPTTYRLVRRTEQIVSDGRGRRWQDTDRKEETLADGLTVRQIAALATDIIDWLAYRGED